jgi:hypothetical protein
MFCDRHHPARCPAERLLITFISDIWAVDTVLVGAAALGCSGRAQLAGVLFFLAMEIVPDEFLTNMLDLNPELVLDTLREQGAALRRPRTVAEVLRTLEMCGCREFSRLVLGTLIGQGPNRV